LYLNESYAMQQLFCVQILCIELFAFNNSLEMHLIPAFLDETVYD